MDIDTKSIDFSQIIENASIGLMICNNNDVLYTNPYIYNLLGYNVYEKLDLKQICHPYYYSTFCNMINKVDMQTVDKSMELKLLHKNGSFIMVHVSVSPYWMNSQLYTQVQVLDTDRFLKTSSTRTDFVISETISEVILEIEPDGKINYVFSSITSLCGYNEKDVVKKNLIDFIHPDDKNTFVRVLENINLSKDPVICRFRLREREDNYIWVEAKVKTFYDESIKRIIASIRNISEQMETEKLLKQSEKLAVIGELSAGVVHEIKNPLTSIKGFLQLMQAGAIKTTDYIAILNTEIERIEKIANDLLSFAKPSEELMKSDINQILDEVIFLIEVQAKKKDINICWDRHEKKQLIMGNPTQLKQVFINLIKNSIEASKEGSKIEVYMQEQGEFINIYVKDYGSGIPKDKLEQIGDSFFTTKEKGTGLGLMVTHKIISNHQGTISVQSEEGKGTTFTVCLPLLQITN